MIAKALIYQITILIFCGLFATTWGDGNQGDPNKTLPLTPTPDGKSSSSLDAKPISSTVASSIMSNAAAAAAAGSSSITPKPNSSPSGKTNTTNCVCDGALLPRIGDNGLEMEICPDCKCKHVSRNTTLIKDDTTSAAQFPTPPNQEINARANVLNRVGHQQDKWKRQVREQRRHIYDRRTMLN